METLRIEIEIGDRKFKADGPVEIVQRQVNAFMKLTVGGNEETVAAEAAAAAKKEKEQAIALDKIMEVAGTIVRLRAGSGTASEVLLVLLLGQRQLRNDNLVSGTDLIQGLRASGHLMSRADYLLNYHARRRYITIHGKRRARRYQLTESGVLKAKGLAQQWIASLPVPANV